MTEEIIYKPLKGAKRKGVLAPGFVTEDKVKVLLEGDPFAVDVPREQVSSPGGQNDSDPVESKKKVSTPGAKKRKKKDDMTTETTKPTGKELRKQCQEFGVEGWEDMSRSDMVKAIKKARKAERAVEAPAEEPKVETKTAPAKKAAAKRAPAKKVAVAKKAAPAKKKAPVKKAAAKKAPAKKTAPKKATAVKKVSVPKTGDALLGITLPKGKTEKSIPTDGGNPFRENSNLFIVAKLLLKGGVRRKLAEQLASKVDINPYQKNKRDIDLDDFDKRIILGAGTMRDKFGYGVQRVGRGLDGKVLVFVPGSDSDPRGKGSKTPAKKTAPKSRGRK